MRHAIGWCKTVPETHQQITSKHSPKKLKKLKKSELSLDWWTTSVHWYWTIQQKLVGLTKFNIKNIVFQETDECKEVFQSLIDELTSKPLLQLYSLDKKVTLTKYASEKTNAEVLPQNGHHVIYIWLYLSKPERKYNNIEREELAVVFAETCLRQSLLRRKFTLKTD